MLEEIAQFRLRNKEMLTRLFFLGNCLMIVIHFVWLSGGIMITQMMIPNPEQELVDFLSDVKDFIGWFFFLVLGTALLGIFITRTDVSQAVVGFYGIFLFFLVLVPLLS